MRPFTHRRGYASRAPGPTSHFYKTFTRPVAKVLLVAVFTYQLTYWGWAKLEVDEHRQHTNAQIAGLEARIGALDQARRAKKEHHHHQQEQEQQQPAPKKRNAWWQRW